MDLDNKTRYPATLFRGAVDEKRLFGSLAMRVTYDLKGTALIPAEKQSWLISPGPWKGPYGPMEGDELFYRGGVDIFISAPQFARRQARSIARCHRAGRCEFFLINPRLWQSSLGKNRRLAQTTHRHAPAVI